MKNEAVIKFLLYCVNKFNMQIYFQNPIKPSIYNTCNENDLYNIINSCLEIMTDFINTHILELIHYDLFDIVSEYTYDVLYVQFIDTEVLEKVYNISKNDAINLLYKCVLLSRSVIFRFYIPRRSYNKSYIRKNINNISYNLSTNFDKINKQIIYLKNIIQPAQRSDEWYIFRNSTLTASNIWKIFISEYSQTQLILEKCEPLKIYNFKVTNTNSPLHWGQKYEPVSILYYEYIYNTKVTDFGCIPHSEYSFIAASPDGIICDSSSTLFGRMIEIKNVVSREITGIPKMEYWIQMQIQMEVCNLNECDFLETKFLEYESEEEYLNDEDTIYKGIILQYYKDESPFYVYAPFMLNDIKSESYIIWLNEQNELYNEYEFIKTIYWRMEKISCVLVLRNKFWFDNILPYIETFWNNLVSERESGAYKARIKKKRKLEIADTKSKSDFPNSGCLINL
jgi:putative phage-type endonuclease